MTIIAAILAIIVHLASLKTIDDWPALSQFAVVEWLGGAPWISSAVLVALALLVYRGPDAARRPRQGHERGASVV